jgi:hypothetical protein
MEGVHARRIPGLGQRHRGSNPSSSARRDSDDSLGYVREIGGSGRYAPLVSRVRRVPGLRSLQFDVNLLPHNDLAAIRVTAGMIPVTEIVCHHIDHMPLSSTKLRDLALRFKRQKRTRMPFIDDLYRVQMIVHRSMIDGYLASKVTEPDPEVDLADITIAEML